MSEISTADSPLGALRELREQLRPVLIRDNRVRWQITDPAGLEHRGIDYLNVPTDRLKHLLDNTCDDLYIQLHKSADGYPESIKTGTGTGPRPPMTYPILHTPPARTRIPFGTACPSADPGLSA